MSWQQVLVENVAIKLLDSIKDKGENVMKVKYDFSKQEKGAMIACLQKHTNAPPHHYEVLNSLWIHGSIVLFPDEALYLAGVIRPYYVFLAERIEQHPGIDLTSRF